MEAETQMEEMAIAHYEQKVQKLAQQYGIVECGACRALNSDLEEICSKCGSVIEIKAEKV